MTSNSSEYRQGRIARQMGQNACPFKEPPEAVADWKRGWRDRDIELISEAFLAGYRNELQMNRPGSPEARAWNYGRKRGNDTQGDNQWT